MNVTSEEPSQNATDQGAEAPSWKRRGFWRQSREKQMQLLLDWLHPDLRNLPDITWANVSGRVIRYMIMTVKKAPYAPHLALVVGAAYESMGAESLYSLVASLHGLLSFLSEHCTAGNDFQLTRAVWEQYVSITERTSKRRTMLLAYSAATESHLPGYIERLDSTTYARITPYVLSPFPVRFLEQHSASLEVLQSRHQRRKAKSDILVPLHSILVALIQFRKQEAQRLLQAFREAIQRVEDGEKLPLEFSYEEILAEVKPSAQTVAEFHLEKKPVVLTFKLWNRRTWTQNHPDDFSQYSQWCAFKGKEAYEPGNDCYFVEYLGNPAQLLWFGDLVQNGLFRNFGTRWTKTENLSEKDAERITLAKSLGMGHGIVTERPGLLTPAGGFGLWLSRYAHQPSGAMIFEPESLYRGVLFASALATLALTNGSRLSEFPRIAQRD